MDHQTIAEHEQGHPEKQREEIRRGARLARTVWRDRVDLMRSVALNQSGTKRRPSSGLRRSALTLGRGRRMVRKMSERTSRTRASPCHEFDDCTDARTSNLAVRRPNVESRNGVSKRGGNVLRSSPLRSRSGLPTRTHRAARAQYDAARHAAPARRDRARFPLADWRGR
jgi:hypothetical protein